MTISIEQTIYKFNEAIYTRWKLEISNSKAASKAMEYLNSRHKPLAPLDIMLTVCKYWEVSLDDVVYGGRSSKWSVDYPKMTMASLLISCSSFCLDKKSMAKIMGLKNVWSLDRYDCQSRRNIVMDSLSICSEWNPVGDAMMRIPSGFTRIEIS